MPTFEFTSPDGKTYSVDGPDGATKEDAWKQLQEHLASSNPQDTDTRSGSTLSGVLKSVPSGAVRGAAALAGLPGDLFHKIYGEAGSPNPIGSEALQQKVAPYIHQPQGALEDIGDRIGQFLPGAAGGPEGILGRIATNAVAPAIASYGAERATGSPIAAGAAALLSPLAAEGGLAALARARSAPAVAPTFMTKPIDEAALDSVKSGSDKFDAARDMGVITTPGYVDKMVGNLREANKVYDQRNPATQHINDLEALAAPVTIVKGDGTAVQVRPAVDMNDIETIRKRISGDRRATESSVRDAASKVHEALTRTQMDLQPEDLIKGDAGLYSKTMKDAVNDYGVGKNLQTLAGKIDLGALNAGSAGVGANENAIRQTLKQLDRPLNNTNVPVWKKLGFKNNEGALIHDTVMGSPYGNTMRYIGKAAPTGTVSVAGSVGLGHWLGGPVGAFGLPAVGYLAKKLGEMDTNSKLKALDSLVRSRSTLAAGVAQQLGPDVVSQLPKTSQNILRSVANPQDAFRRSAGAGVKGYNAAKKDQGKP